MAEIKREQMEELRVRNMMDLMIQKHGFEKECVIEFFQIAEDYLNDERPFEDVLECFWVNYWGGIEDVLDYSIRE